ncbi:MAG: hypothetical protein IPH64_13010 [Comamonadaceae bacterium]|nr:hypothetical protein [Comamonadaceae bacterium]
MYSDEADPEQAVYLAASEFPADVPPEHRFLLEIVAILRVQWLFVFCRWQPGRAVEHEAGQQATRPAPTRTGPAVAARLSRLAAPRETSGVDTRINSVPLQGCSISKPAREVQRHSRQQTSTCSPARLQPYEQSLRQQAALVKTAQAHEHSHASVQLLKQCRWLDAAQQPWHQQGAAQVAQRVHRGVHRAGQRR